MQDSIVLFKKTISSLLERKKQLSESIHLNSVTGSSTRMLNPERVSKFDELWKVESILSKSKPIIPPKQNGTVEVGHMVVLTDSNNHKQSFHICSKLDVIYSTMRKRRNNKLLSVNSSLGKKLLGKKVGDKMWIGLHKQTIVEIEVSEYV